MADITYVYVPTTGSVLTSAGVNENLYSTTAGRSIYGESNGGLEYLNFDPAFKVQSYQVRPGQAGRSVSYGRTPSNDYFSDMWVGSGVGYIPVAGCCVTFYTEYPISMAMFSVSAFVSGWRQFGSDNTGAAWPTRLAAPDISIRTFFAAPNGGITTHLHSQRDLPQTVFLRDPGALAGEGSISMVEQRLTRHYNLHHPRMIGGTSPCDPVLAGEHTFGLAVLVKQNLSGQNTASADEAWRLSLNNGGGAFNADARPMTNYSAVQRLRFYCRGVTAMRLL